MTYIRAFLLWACTMALLSSLGCASTPKEVNVSFTPLDTGRLSDPCLPMLKLSSQNAMTEEAFLDWYTVNHLRSQKCSTDKQKLVDALRAAGYIK